MTRILNAEPDGYSYAATEVLRSFAEVVEQPVDRAGFRAALPGFDALIVRLGFRVDHELLAAGTRLRAVATATTGLDHVDLAEAAARGIEVISLKGEREFLDGVHATAEHTWALLLALLRRVPWAMASVVDGHWERDEFRGRELFGKRLGIVGLGRVGRQVAEFGRAFGMSVAAYDVDDGQWPSDVERSPTLGRLLDSSDVVALHVPLEESTRGLIGEQELAVMRPTAVLINTARGALVDEGALLAALEGGKVSGAALDVLADEPTVSRSTRLLEYAATHDNLVVTPHIAGATHESMAQCEVFVAKRLAEFFLGGHR